MQCRRKGWNDCFQKFSFRMFILPNLPVLLLCTEFENTQELSRNKLTCIIPCKHNFRCSKNLVSSHRFRAELGGGEIAPRQDWRRRDGLAVSCADNVMVSRRVGLTARWRRRWVVLDSAGRRIFSPPTDFWPEISSFYVSFVSCVTGLITLYLQRRVVHLSASTIAGLWTYRYRCLMRVIHPRCPGFTVMASNCSALWARTEGY